MSKEKEEKNDKKAEKTPEIYTEKTSTTSHAIVIDEQTVAYTATAGTLTLKSEDGKPQVSIFYVAYTRDDVEDTGQRPITFAFNGGPGSSSVWLHLGMLGPKRVHMSAEGDRLPPPSRLVDNEYALLDVTDLVFIDPVSTGYSRVQPDDDAKKYHSFEKDIESVAEFIRRYTSQTSRWLSPKFLIGESYGTTRAAGLATYLQEKIGMELNGIMLVSSILNFQTARFTSGNDLPYILFLPTYAATAWYHKQLGDDFESLEALLAEVEAFALNQYTVALMRGSQLDADTRSKIITQLARFTGLSADFIDRSNLRIEIMRFCKELLRHQKRSVGRLDSRFTGIDRDAVGEHMQHDPSLTAIIGPYSTTFNDYIRRDLGFESDLPYEILTGRVHPWSFEKFENQFVDVAETLRSAMTKNPFLKIHIANGYYDIATPYFATQYTINHLGLDPSLQGNISMSYYPAGHMMYTQLASLAALKERLAAFIYSSKPNT